METTSARRVLALLRRSLAPKGLDVIIPLTVESYNQYLEEDTSAASDLTRFQLPIVSDALASHLLVLVGNSRAMWGPFLSNVSSELKHSGQILPNPIDRYVQLHVETTIKDLKRDGLIEPIQTYWVADTTPGKMILAQKMALAARVVTRCPPSQLCLHPTLGPWLAFRCALVFPVEGIHPISNAEEGDAEPMPEQPSLCSHDDSMHDLLAAQMADALAQVQPDNPGVIRPDAWKKWVMPRITIAPSHRLMYSSEQILYHYTKDLAFLANIVRTKEQNLCTDYLRNSPPPAAVECRKLVQTVLREYRDKHPEGIDAISLSGGLDTSIIAEASDQEWETDHGIGVFSLDKASRARPILRFDHAFTVQAKDEAKDAYFAGEIFKRLRGYSLSHHHVIKASLEDLLSHAPAVAKLLVSCDPMELRNSLVIYATLEQAARLGVKRIVTGDGADEIFCGYGFYHKMDEEALIEYRDQIIRVMQFTASRLAQAFEIEVISPFLDERVIAFAQTLSKQDLVGERTPVPVDGPDALHGKLLLRQAFPEAFSQWRSKQPIEEGAGTTALRMGFFDGHWSQEEFEHHQKKAFRDHGIVIRDREHLFFFRAFLDAFDGDLALVPKRRRTEKDEEEEEETSDGSFCPACRFELSHAAQDFCVTCGFWPTRITPTNDKSGYATQALTTLATTKKSLAETR
ncbi:hypothetical protein Poli38472_003541 [Pythium oligandrum]|uniref:Asparagine synthetase domain-containing protein n=1 Tax=Pythium oligandrum TaxID=41045 RepID=A0A8K1FCU7_PYTOL|nr:hypothetical protein Poli38472_003541 [Pythium oligandrum]|eukprot:TMW57616.1 hypothetical protein Poli38472_003541 [Pythium oligandrum]